VDAESCTGACDVCNTETRECEDYDYLCSEVDCEVCVDGDCESECSSAENCCNGECCNNYSGICCGDNECCHWTEGEVCCVDTCCNPACCDSSECEHCVEGECEPCLSKPADYDELEACTGEIVPDPTWTPQPNGCSSPTGNNPAGGVCGEASSFLSACNTHDTCYQTCNSNWSACDGDFYQDMMGICAPLSGTCKSVCEWWAGTYYTFVSGGAGLEAWKEDQVDACACCYCE
jgi:hypothetical protein